jgi:uncharacterized protein
LNYLCAGYKRFFQHVDPYMKFMANELRHQRPPANIMAWIRQSETRCLLQSPESARPAPAGENAVAGPPSPPRGRGL